MPKYFFQGSYSVEGIRGLQKDGGSKRRAAAQQAAQSVGGKVDAFYFALAQTTSSASLTCLIMLARPLCLWSSTRREHSSSGRPCC